MMARFCLLSFEQVLGWSPISPTAVLVAIGSNGARRYLHRPIFRCVFQQACTCGAEETAADAVLAVDLEMI